MSHRGSPSYRNESENESCLVVSDCLRSHVLYSPWNSPGQNTGVISLSLLQGIFPTQGLNPGLPHCRWILCKLSHKGSPIIEILPNSFWKNVWFGFFHLSLSFFFFWPGFLTYFLPDILFVCFLGLRLCYIYSQPSVSIGYASMHDSTNCRSKIYIFLTQKVPKSKTWICCMLATFT